jgi:drug/metabolite transporter (DMT)-like permease
LSASETPAAHAEVQRNGLGIVLRVAAMFCMAGLSALVKWCSGRGVPVLEIIFFRNAFAFVPVLIYVHHTSGFSVLKTRRPLGHLMRSAVGLTAMFCGFSAVALMPLTQSTALAFSSPLFMTALSALILKEPVGRHRWAAVAVGFVGVLIMVHPDPTHFAGRGVVLALAGALGAAGAMIAIREIGRTEPGPTIVFYFTLGGAALGLASLPFGWVIPDLATLGLLVAAGLVGGVGQLLLTEALRRAAVAVVAPFDYPQLVWASLIGYFVWGETPQTLTLAGAAVVAASGVYILFRETRRFRVR